MGIFDELDKQKKNKGGIFDELDKQSIIKPTFKERMLGTPVKQADGTYKATTGVLPFFGAIPKATLETGKSLVQGTINTGKTLGESLSVNRGDFNALEESNQMGQDIQYNLIKKINENKKLGKNTSKLEQAYKEFVERPQETIQSLAPSSQKTNLQALGDLAMMGTEMIMPGEASVGGVSGKLLARKTIENLVLSKTKSEVEKMLAKKTLFNIFSGYGYDVGSKLAEGKTNAKEVLSPGIATLLSAIFSGAETKTLLKSAGAREAGILQDRALTKANFGKIPEAGTPPTGYFNKNVKQLESPFVDNIKIEPIQNKNITQDVKYKKPTQKELETGYEPYKPDSKLPEIQTDPDYKSTKPIADNVNQTQTTSPIKSETSLTDNMLKEQTPEYKNKVNDDLDYLKKTTDTTDDSPDVLHMKNVTERFNREIVTDREKLINYVTSDIPNDPNMPKFWTHKLLAKHADEVGDVALSDTLALTKDYSKEAGRTLVGGKLNKNKSTADIQREIRNTRAKELGKSEDALRKEELNLFEKYKKDSGLNYSKPADYDIIKKDIIC